MPGMLGSATSNHGFLTQEYSYSFGDIILFRYKVIYHMVPQYSGPHYLQLVFVYFIVPSKIDDS